MKKILVLSFILLIPLISVAQLSESELAFLERLNTPQIIAPEEYDSLENYVYDNVGKYVGQTLILKGSEKQNLFGISGLKIKPTYSIVDDANPDYVYKRLPGKHGTDLNKVLDLRFQVVNILLFDKNPSNPTKTYLKLFCENNDTVYYEYQSNFDNVFLVEGFYEKMKQVLIGKEYAYNKDNNYNIGTEYHGIRGITTDEEVKNIPKGSFWKCTNVIIPKTGHKQLIALIENEYYGKCYILTTDLFKGVTKETSKFIPKEEYDSDLKKISDEKELILKKYGKQVADLINKGIVKIGWTEQMCIYSWGKPNEINKTTTQDGVSKQWVYSNNRYLYFKNGKLTTIQD